MKHLDNLAIWLLCKLTNDPKEHIEWELGHARVNNIDFEYENESKHAEEAYNTGFSLINFITGYLNIDCKIKKGWVPVEHQSGHWDNEVDQYTGTYDGRF